MTPAEADRQNVEDFANESADLLRRALAAAAKRRADEWEQITGIRLKAKPKLNNSIPKRGELYEINGTKKTIPDWCIHYGIERRLYQKRRSNGMTIVEALQTPVRKKRVNYRG